ncbi:MAG TPA: AraC family transcriptional regulator, partial [Gammaproteobacteria bacterium]
MYTTPFKLTLKRLTGILLLYICISPAVFAENEAGNLKITQNIQNLKNEVLELNRDLFVLEEELLFSANTQINVFLSMDAGHLFKLDSVQLKIDDKIVTNYLYTDRELRALQRGGVQRLHIGNMSAGEHEITAILVGE